jgi:hypothetical protein
MPGSAAGHGVQLGMVCSYIAVAALHCCSGATHNSAQVIPAGVCDPRGRAGFTQRVAADLQLLPRLSSAAVCQAVADRFSWRCHHAST